MSTTGSLPKTESDTLPSVPADLNHVFGGRGGEVPAGNAQRAGGETAVQGHHVFHVAGRGQIGRRAVNLFDRAKEEIKNVQGVRANVKEQPAAGMLGNQPPFQLARRDAMHLVAGVAIVEHRHLAQPAGVDQFLRLQEPRQPAAIVGHEQRQTGRRKGLDHAAALGMIAGHRLLDVSGLACRGHAEGIFQVRAGRRGDIDRVDLRIVESRPRRRWSSGRRRGGGRNPRPAPHRGA